MSAPEDLQSRLRERGFRMTPQRALVLAAVAALEHATPDDVLAEVRRTASGINISTVYRTLDLLEDLGLVRHTHLGHGAPSYSSSDTDDHVHLTCRECGAVDEVSPSVVHGVVDALASQRGFAVDVGHLTIFGTCSACAAGRESSGASSG